MSETLVQDGALLMDDDSLAGEEKYLTFTIGEEEFGLNIRNVTEIVGIQKITELPDVPEYIKGVINLRGKVIPVIDMRLRFALDEREYDERTCIIVVDVNGQSVGLIVDTVSEVLDISQDQIDPPPHMVDDDSNEFIEGIGRVESEVKILLNITKVVKMQEVMMAAE
jgi:purine-binding chemotaxis protein CheW